MSGGAAAGLVRGHPRTNRRRSGRWPRDGAAPPDRLPPAQVGGVQPCPQLGRTPEIPPHAKGRSRVLKTVVGKRCQRPFGGRFPNTGSPPDGRRSEERRVG